ncbi:MAG TPA: zinc-binding dehydrogenase [Oscillatoriales cyanobacterium M59_W2019_021]|nr:MAG: hypothetical protein D6728_17480 [Cyanobacteria bacterium J055]HIK30707.1 zinc-binding dehydrogenase [Oscillatoriales cyanobacterium M4454_W2019_049]HIK51893.1 zinc-binding dehydrogenase [Oscillatoriales cyanobacterium M59_W2019_021]
MVYCQWEIRRSSDRYRSGNALYPDDFCEAGKIVPFVDRCYDLSEVPAAICDLEQEQARGKITINIRSTTLPSLAT